MTAQIAEKLIFQGAQVEMCTEPLDQYFELSGIEPPFDSLCTALWRGYIGLWEIIDDRLYLMALDGTLADGTDASLETLFPGFPDRVFAHWYSGTIRIPQGRELEYIHAGYASVFERDLFLDFDRGVVVRTWIHQNGTADRDDAPDAYHVAAMTVFPRTSSGDGSES